MSKSYKTRVAFVKSILDNLGGPKKYKTLRLTKRDYLTARDAIHLWLFLLRDKCISSYEEKGDMNAVIGIQGRILEIGRLLEDIDLYGLLSTLDSVSQYLLGTTTGEKPMAFAPFKQEMMSSCQSEVQQKFFRTLAGLIKQLCRQWFVHANERAFGDLRAIFCFLLRLSLKDVDSLKEAAYKTWFETEMRDWNQDYSGPEVQVISEWFPIEDTALIAEFYAPHHGAGSTFEGAKTSFEKSQLNECPGLVKQVQLVLNWPYQICSNTLMASPFSDAYKECHETEIQLARRHRVTVVPKNWKTYRVISMEEVGLMFAQQGAMTAIFDYLKGGYTEFAHHYCVNTEARNRHLAKLGSITGEYSTLDMSAASDSVPLDLVTHWFNESCLVWLVMLRSKFAVLHNDQDGRKTHESLIEVKKFAPMGSALCFPIECIVFGAIVEAVLRKHFGRNHHLIWYVYGDDLVIPTVIVDDVIERLTQLGFRVNCEKSFYNVRDEKSQNLFRESCGGEYLNGIDVTPPRIPRKFEGLYYGSQEKELKRLGKSAFEFTNVSSAAEATYLADCSNLPTEREVRLRSIAKLVMLANDLYEHSPTARWAIVNRLLNELKLPILTDSDGERGIRTASPTNYHLRRFINTRTQGVEVLCWQLRAKRKSSDLYDSNQEYQAYRSLAHRCYLPDEDTSGSASCTERKTYAGWLEECNAYRKHLLLTGLGPVLLYEYLRLAERKNRSSLLWPEEAMTIDMDPRSYEMTVRPVLVPAETVSDFITTPEDWSYSNWNADTLWLGHEGEAAYAATLAP